MDSPKDARPVQDYSWNGAFLSYDDSVRRLGENIKICGLRCHDPEAARVPRGLYLCGNRAGSGRHAIEQASRRWHRKILISTRGSLEGLSALRQRHGTEVSIGLNDADVALGCCRPSRAGRRL